MNIITMIIFTTVLNTATLTEEQGVWSSVEACIAEAHKIQESNDHTIVECRVDWAE